MRPSSRSAATHIFESADGIDRREILHRGRIFCDPLHAGGRPPAMTYQVHRDPSVAIDFHEASDAVLCVQIIVENIPLGMLEPFLVCVGGYIAKREVAASADVDI